MIYLYVFLTLAALGLIYMRFEATFVEVRYVNFTKAKNSLKILQLSDIHINHLKVSPQKVKSIIDKESPDLVVMTGDYIEERKNIPAFLNFLEEIKGKHNILLALGNHDYEAFEQDTDGLSKYIQQIGNTGVTILHDRSICFEKNSRKYNVIGITDLRCGSHNIAESLKSCSKDVFMNIAFSHNPDIVLNIPKGKVDYLFCGHFHGGQIWAPFDLEYRLLRHEKLCKMGIKKGLHKVNGINIYISRGLGCVCFPLRFLSRPEITVFYMP